MLHRAPKEAVHILWVLTLPVIPYLINHLSSETNISVSYPLDNVEVAIPHDAKRKVDLYSPSTSTQTTSYQVHADAPFGDQVNPGVQFCVAVGHLPPRSLEVME